MSAFGYCIAACKTIPNGRFGPETDQVEKDGKRTFAAERATACIADAEVLHH